MARWPTCQKPALVTALLFACATPAAHASRYPSTSFSLDWIVQSSDLVALATITHREALPATGQQRWQSPRWFRLTAKISETFKGDPAPSELTFLAYDGEPGPNYFSLPPNGAELILGLSRTNRWRPWPAGPWVRDCPTTAAAFFLTTQAVVPAGGRADYFLDPAQSWDAYAIDWTHADVVPINGRKNILTALRRICAESTAGPDVPSGYWCLDWEPIAGEPEHTWRYPAGWDYVSFPADQRLESAAERWAGSANPAVRQRAALFLDCFQGPRSIALWKQLMEDPFRVPEPHYPYPVRCQAYELLRARGVTLPPRCIDAPAIATRRVDTILIAGPVIALAATLVLLSRRAWRGITVSIALPATVICLTALLLARGATTIDCLHARVGSSRLEISTWAGRLHLLWRSQAASHGVFDYGSAARNAELDQEWASPVWTATHAHRRLGFRYESGSAGPWGACRLVAIPLWAILAPALASLLAASIRRARARTRRRRGACEVCGYDLRATPQRCPECGHAPDRTRRTDSRKFAFENRA